MPRRGRVTEFTMQAADTDERSRVDVAANALRSALDRNEQPAFLKVGDDEPVELPPVVARMLSEAMTDLAESGRVVVAEADQDLTPRQAAEVLGLSRTFVDRLLKDGTIPSHRLPDSRHQRIRFADVMAFQNERERRRKGVNSIVEEALDAGLEY